MDMHFGMEVQVKDASFSSEYSRMLFEAEIGIILSGIEAEREDIIEQLQSDPSALGVELYSTLVESIVDQSSEMQLSEALDLDQQEVQSGFGMQLVAGKTESGDLLLLVAGLMEVHLTFPGLTAGDLVQASAPSLAAILASAALRVLMIDLLQLSDVTVEFGGFDDEGQPKFVISHE